MLEICTLHRIKVYFMKHLSIAADQTQDTNWSYTRRRSLAVDSKPRVLLVDDEPSILRGIKRILSKDWNVEIAVGASTAASMLTATQYDAIVTDYDMPGRDGLWLLDYVRTRFPQMRRILLSGSEPFIFSNHMKSGLIQHYIPKPATTNSLFASLEF